MRLFLDSMKRGRLILYIAICTVWLSACGKEPLDQTVPSAETGVENKETVTSETEVEPPSFLNIEEVTLSIQGLSRDYQLAWVSDLHIIADCFDLEGRPDVNALHYDAIRNRYENFKTADGIYAVDLWDDIVDWFNTQNLDGVILGGDMLDYYSEANIQAFEKEYDRIEAPAMYIRADHDYGIWYSENAGYASTAFGEQGALDGDDWSSHHLDLGEIVIAGINNSQTSISDDMWEQLEAQMTLGKPMILASHVPFRSSADTSLYDLSMAVREKEYYWPSETYQPGPAQAKLIEAINQPDTAVKQILVGHLHASWDGMMNEYVPEHIFGPAFAGNIGIINVVSK